MRKYKFIGLDWIIIGWFIGLSNIIVKYYCQVYHIRSQSKGVRKYKFKIKKENERCLEYLVEDHDPEEENIKFTIPLAFQVRRCVSQ